MESMEWPIKYVTLNGWLMVDRQKLVLGLPQTINNFNIMSMTSMDLWSSPKRHLVRVLWVIWAGGMS